MRCTQCGYALWNIRPGACPECGKHFRVIDFRLPDHAVSFLCPLCKHANRPEIIDDRGLPVPKQFRCKGCNEYIDVNKTVVVPDNPNILAHTGSLPWVEREKLSLREAWWRTAKLAVLKPRDLGRAMPEGCGLGKPWQFLAINVGLFLLIGIVGQVVDLATSMFFMMGLNVGMSLNQMFLYLLLSAVMSLITSIIALPFIALITAGAAHLILMLFGESRSFERTFAAVTFASSAVIAGSVVGIVPYVGTYAALAGWGWWFIATGIILSEMHVIEGWKAGIAAAVGPVCGVLLCCGGGVAFSGAFYAAAMPMFTAVALGGMTQGTTLASDSFLQDVYNDAAVYRSEHGAWPNHVLELLIDEPQRAYQQGDEDYSFGWVDPAEAGLNEEWYTLTPLQMRADIQNVIDAQPRHTEAHRFGMVVYVWHSLPTVNPDPRLWLAVTSVPGDGSAMTWAGDYQVTVLKADGSLEHFDKAELSSKLNEQNALRQSLDLPLVPAPRTISHVKPGAPADIPRDTNASRPNNVSDESLGPAVDTALPADAAEAEPAPPVDEDQPPAP